MKPLYTESEFEISKSSNNFPFECYTCQSTFYRPKKEVKYVIKSGRDAIKYCSRQCIRESKIKLTCNNCSTQFNRNPSDILKSNNNFCSLSCTATYNNKHKTHGTRRSKLEVYIEEQLTLLYPDLPIEFNSKQIIGSELDIYIPSINLAIELNGIFHYEPIYGKDKLGKIQENDQSKIKACHYSKIDLSIIDTSTQKYFKPSTSQKYLDIITNIIKERLTS